MITKSCGCSTATCGCCEGTQALTPAPVINRPGLDALRYRVGTHAAFLETMKARVASMTVDAPGADGQTVETFQPLRGLTTREAGDPAIALLDSVACVADVLTFYQERIANEGYLRTATERRSIVELARLVGYALRPGVAATVYLAYTLDDKQTDPVEIPVGARSQTIPGPDEFPQSFETSDNLLARSVWNNLQVRLHRPQNITVDNALAIETMYVAGTSTNLKVGDELLLVFGGDDGPSVVRTVAESEVQFADKRTAIRLQPVPFEVVAAMPALAALVNTMRRLVTDESNGATHRVKERAEQILNDTYLGLPSIPVHEPPHSGTSDFPGTGWVARILNAADGEIQLPVLGEISRFASTIGTEPVKPQAHPVTTDPAEFVERLLKPANPQARTSFQLRRSLSRAFASGADVHPQLLVSFAPQLKDTYYTAWANATVNDAAPLLKGLYALRVTAPLFGANVPKPPDFDKRRLPIPPDQLIRDWPLADEAGAALFLDRAYDEILPDSYVVIQTNDSSKHTRLALRVLSAQAKQRAAYGISGKTTQLTFQEEWWAGSEDSMSTLRDTLVFAQSEKLDLADEPMAAEVNGQEIELGALYNELTSGRWVIFSGERADIDGVRGVRVSERLMISGLKHGYDATLPGDTTHTTLELATPTAYTYKRDTLTIYGNVVKATHGETRNEALGSGDGSQTLPAFALKQPPLTFVPAANPSGVDSTLKVYVNDVEWHEADTLAGLSPTDRKFITKTDNDAKTTVIFGNGAEGARLPTGVENVKAVYRNGIGKGGNARAEQISLLQTRPLGVKGVINPLRASGGADKENRDQARDNAPLAVMALDRLVSLQDYADFTQTFAGIAKADARRLSASRHALVHLTVAGADDIPIDPESDLYGNLLAALRAFGDPDLPLQVDLRELLILVLSVNVHLEPDYQWEPVVTAIRTVLLDGFGFAKRSLGQTALLSEAISLIQHVDGVAYADVDAFGGIPEKTVGRDGKRRLLTLDELAVAVQMIVDSSKLLRVADVTTLGRLVAELNNTENAVARYVKQQFSTATQDRLGKFDGSASDDPGLTLALVTEINALIIGQPFYMAPGFDADRAHSLATRQPQGQALVALNRLLLDEACDEIGKSPRASRSGPTQHVVANVAAFENNAVRPAQLAIFTAAVADTLIVNQIK